MFQAVAMVVAFLNIKEIPIADGKVAFDDDQRAKLEKELTPEMVNQLVEAFNKEIEENSQVKSISAEIKKILEASNTSQEDAANSAKEKVPGEKAKEDDSADANLVKLKALMQQKDETIKALINSAEGDIPFQVIKGGKAKEIMKHSATHLFGENKAYNAFEGRNWNLKAAGLSVEATDYTEGTTIDKLNGDMELFFRENPDVIKSLHRDNFGLPASWPKKLGVVDRVNSGAIVSAEITQARKLPWLPKNKQLIQAEEGKIYPISVDIEFVGQLLSSIEASWLNSFNKEGSQAYKMTFVRFLVEELDKKARSEDRIASIKGIYVATPDNATTGAKFINRQNGLLYLAWKARDLDAKYRAFKLGTPTTSNIVDYVDNFIKALPEDVRNSTGLQLNLSPTWITAYKRRYEQVYGLFQDYKGYPPNPKDYPNIKFEAVIDFEGTDFMNITFDNNIEILENLPKEKSLYTFEKLLRKIYVFADYKLGIRIVHIGTKVKSGDPDEFKVQSFWSNDVPIFKDDFYIPIFDDTTGAIVANYNHIKVDDAWATDITAISGMVPGQIIKVQGNVAMAAIKNVKNNAALVLTADFNLKTGGTLTMFVMPDGKFKELSRTTAPAAVLDPKVNYTTAAIDASLGSEFNFAGVAPLTITSVINGVTGDVIKITGKAGLGTDVTIATINNIVMASSATLATELHYVELVLSDGLWVEINRVIV